MRQGQPEEGVKLVFLKRQSNENIHYAPNFLIMKKYYNYRKIDSYNTPIRIVISRRGLGKTFGALLKAVKGFIDNGKRFIYVVENDEQAKELSRNKGEKFFGAILNYLENPVTFTDKKLSNAILGKSLELSEGDILNQLKGGVILINGVTAGYIVSLNSFARFKRNNFVNVKYIIVDEFIPEIVDVRTLQNPRKIVSLVQSIARNSDVIIYLLGNSIRLNDSILARLGLHNLKEGEISVIKDDIGPFIACHFVSNKEYPLFVKEAEKSVSGRLASILNEDNLDKNTFVDDLNSGEQIPSSPKQSTIFCCLHGEFGSVRVNITKDYEHYYVYPDYGDNIKKRVCLDKRYISPVVRYIPDYYDAFTRAYEKGAVKFYDAQVKSIFKNILKLI